MLSGAFHPGTVECMEQEEHILCNEAYRRGAEMYSYFQTHINIVVNLGV